MALKKIYRIIDERPMFFLIPPVLVFIFIDLYFSVDPVFLIVFPVLALVATHFYLILLKGVFKKERDVEEEDGLQRYAFPSYHTGIATCLCTAQSLLLPQTAPIMAAFVTITAMGRIELDRHDWKDVTSAVAFVLPMVLAFYLLTSFYL